MTVISWLLCIGTFLAALACQQDMPGHPIITGLWIASFLSCPLIWRTAIMTELLNGRQRFMACLALILALPLVLIPAS